MRARILGIGVATPGMPDWPTAAAVLRGEQPYAPAPLPHHVPQQLPANERRRLTPTIRLALQAASEATAGHPELRAEAAAVFASVCGDLAITERLCRALPLPERPVSPVDFHNSVHNAPAGYWAIASHSRAPSTSLSAGDDSVCSGLEEAVMQLQAGAPAVLLVAYEMPPPVELAWPGAPQTPFACGLLLGAVDHGQGTLMTLGEPMAEMEPNRMDQPSLEALRQDHAAARALPLLALLASGKSGTLRLPRPYNRAMEIGITQ